MKNEIGGGIFVVILGGKVTDFSCPVPVHVSFLCMPSFGLPYILVLCVCFCSCFFHSPPAFATEETKPRALERAPGPDPRESSLTIQPPRFLLLSILFCFFVPAPDKPSTTTDPRRTQRDPFGGIFLSRPWRTNELLLAAAGCRCHCNCNCNCSSSWCRCTGRKPQASRNRCHLSLARLSSPWPWPNRPARSPQPAACSLKPVLACESCLGAALPFRCLRNNPSVLQPHYSVSSPFSSHSSLLFPIVAHSPPLPPQTSHFIKIRDLLWPETQKNKHNTQNGPSLVNRDLFTFRPLTRDTLSDPSLGRHQKPPPPHDISHPSIKRYSLPSALLGPLFSLSLSPVTARPSPSRPLPIVFFGHFILSPSTDTRRLQLNITTPSFTPSLSSLLTPHRWCL